MRRLDMLGQAIHTSMLAQFDWVLHDRMNNVNTHLAKQAH